MNDPIQIARGSMHTIEAPELLNLILGVTKELIPGVTKITRAQQSKEDYPKIGKVWLDKSVEYLLISNSKIESHGSIFHIARKQFEDMGILFYNCILPDLAITDIELKSLYIVECDVKQITFSGSNNIPKVDLNTIEGVGISITDETMISLLDLDFSQLSDGVQISRKSNIYRFESKSSKCKKLQVTSENIVQGIMIRNKSDFKDISIGFSGSVTSLKVYDSKVDMISVKEKGKLGSCELVSKSIVDAITCEGSSSIGNLKIDQSICGTIVYSNNVAPAQLSVTNQSQTGNLLLHNATFDSIDITGNSFGFRSFNSTTQVLKIEDSQLSFLDWQTGSNGNVFVNKCIILHFSLSNITLTKDTIFSLSNCQFQYFFMENLFVQGTLFLRNINPLRESFTWKGKAPLSYKLDDAIDEEENLWHKEIGYKHGKSFNDYFIDLIFKNHHNCKQVYARIKAAIEKMYHDRPSLGVLSYTVDIVDSTGIVTIGGDPEEDDEALKEHILNHVYNKDSIFRISQSSLNKTEITDSNLNGFRFEFFNSKLLDCFISGTQLSKSKIDIHIYNPGKDEFFDSEVAYEQKVSFYSQLKKIFENQGNVVEASWYHARAMENQQQLLSILFKQQSGNWYTKLKSDRFFDLFTFWLNKKSNYHGESWGRALKFIFLSSLMAYTCYYLTIHGHQPFDLKGSGTFIGDYFSFLDITHRIDFHVPKEQLNAWSKFCDYAGKIVISYGLFQLVAAFRRHGKKNV